MCLSLSCLAKKSSFGHRPLPSSTINRFVFRLVRLEVHNLTPLVTWPNSVRHATTHCPSLSKAKVRVSHMTPSCDWNSSRPLSFNLLAPYEHIFFLVSLHRWCLVWGSTFPYNFSLLQLKFSLYRNVCLCPPCLYPISTCLRELPPFSVGLLL